MRGMPRPGRLCCCGPPGRLGPEVYMGMHVHVYNNHRVSPTKECIIEPLGPMIGFSLSFVLATDGNWGGANGTAAVSTGGGAAAGTAEVENLSLNFFCRGADAGMPPTGGSTAACPALLAGSSDLSLRFLDSLGAVERSGCVEAVCSWDGGLALVVGFGFLSTIFMLVVL